MSDKLHAPKPRFGWPSRQEEEPLRMDLWPRHPPVTNWSPSPREPWIPSPEEIAAKKPTIKERLAKLKAVCDAA